jgi:hypothetical protein
MPRRAPPPRLKDDSPGKLSPVDALMLKLENISPQRLERLGADEERRRAAETGGKRVSRLEKRPAKGPGESSNDGSPKLGATLTIFSMPASDDGFARQAPGEWAAVHGNSMAGHGLRHGDRVRLDHDMEPSDGDIVLAQIEGVGRVLRKLSIIGGVHVLSADAGVRPIAVDDLSQIAYHGVVVGRPKS